MTRVYNFASLRALVLYAQDLPIPNPQFKPDADAIHNRVDKLGCVQMDPLQMVQRSQYLVLWSRLGSYDPEAFFPWSIAQIGVNLKVGSMLIPIFYYRQEVRNKGQ